MVEAPSALQAAGGFRHSPSGDKEGKDLPMGAVQVLDVGESREPQAGQEGAEGEDDGASEGLMPEVKDGEAKMHDFSG